MNIKKINIFLSSTFHDMHAERDYIKKMVEPRLNFELEKYGIKVYIIDLRWGVHTQNEPEEKRESKVLDFCFKTIQECRPYFIALLGNRYGWIPPHERVKDTLTQFVEGQEILKKNNTENLSVTGMEILFGALSNYSLLKHCLFLFRDNDVYDNIDDEDFNNYVDRDSRMIISLREKIRKTCELNNLKIFPYHPKWNSQSKCFCELDEIGDVIYNHIINDLKPGIRFQTISDSQRQRFESESFLRVLKLQFHGRKDTIKFLFNFLDHNLDAQAILSQPSAYVITGEPCSGKSSILAELYFLLTQKKESEKIIILLHTAGITMESKSEKFFLEALANTLALHCDDQTNYTGKEIYIIKKNIPNLIHKCQIRGYKIILLLDSFESFNCTDEVDNLIYLPSSIRSIITAKQETAELLCKKNPKFKKLEIGRYDYNDAKALIYKTLDDNHKTLPTSLIDLILSKKLEDGSFSHSQAMWIQITMAILIELGRKDFQDIYKIAAEDDEKKIYQFLEAKIREFPCKITDLFVYFIKTTAENFNSELVKRCLYLIALSRYGISEQDLATILKDYWDEIDFQCIYKWMRHFLYKSSTDEKITFTHSVLRNAALTVEESIREECRQKWTDFLMESFKDNQIKENELCQMLIEENNYYSFMRMRNYGCDFSYFIATTLMKEGTNTVSDFITNYCNLYNEDFALAEEVHAYLCTLAIGEKNLSVAKDFFERISSLFGNNLFENGNSYQINIYLRMLFREYEYYFKDKNDLNGMRKALEYLKYIYFTLKNRFPRDASFIPYNIRYSGFYYYWHIYLFRLEMSDRYGNNPIIKKEYSSEFFSFIDEVFWYVKYTNHSINKVVCMPIFFKNLIRTNNFMIERKDMVRIAKKIKVLQEEFNQLTTEEILTEDRESVYSFILDLDNVISHK